MGPGPRALERAPWPPRGWRACWHAPSAWRAALEQAIQHPQTTAREVAEAVEGVGEIGWAFANPAPKVPLNVEIGSHRRFTWVRSDLADFKRIKDALGGTVNDVVLAVVAGALRDWLHARGIRTEGLELRAQVPVSIRAEDERGQLGNRLAVMRAPLPVYIEDPVRRLQTVTRGDAGAEAVQAGARRRGDLPLQRLRPAHTARTGGADQLLDPPLQPGGDQCARARRCPCTCSVASWRTSSRSASCRPNQALFVAIMSYNGGINFGLLADYDSMDDLELIARGIERSIAELADAAEAAGEAPEPEPADADADTAETR